MIAANWTPGWRAEQIRALKAGDTEFDLIVIGGGITGAGVYREACARGLTVLLVDQKDFAWGTSSRSSKMVHGGLRYLGKGQFGLAKDSVTERQNLMEQLQGLVDPLPFLMGHYKGGFPGPWVFDKLLAIYDFFAGKKYRKFIESHVQDYWAPGVRSEDLLGVTHFMDAVTDDARLVMRVLDDGNRLGGTALNYLKATDLLRDASGVTSGVCLQDDSSGDTFHVRSRAVVNASGAWTDELRQKLGHKKHIRPLRGSHLVVPFWRLPVSFSVSFFHPEDKRPVFVFPWEGQTVIGTTDLDHKPELNQEAHIHADELRYLLDAANYQFSKAELTASDVTASWSGVRPVVVDGYDSSCDDSDPEQATPSDEKREHMIWDDQGCVSIAGGKLTTFRLLALEVLRAAQPYLSDKLSQRDLTETSDFEPQTLPDSLRLSASVQRRLIGRYGARVHALLKSAEQSDLRHLGTSETLLQELRWACRNECVTHLDDLLLRRVRIGMLQPNGARALIQPLAELLRRELGWSSERWQDEWQRYMGIVQRYYSVPLASSSGGRHD
jgi:glycerol-3-phosphate dehydrogenase